MALGKQNQRYSKSRNHPHIRLPTWRPLFVQAHGPRRRFLTFLIQAIVGFLILTAGGALATHILPSSFGHLSGDRASAFSLQALQSTPKPALSSNLFNSSTSPVVAQTVSIRDRVEQGQDAYESERYAEAIAHWQAALDQLPPQALPNQRLLLITNLALAQQRLGKWASVKTLIEEGTPYAVSLLQDSEHSPPFSDVDGVNNRVNNRVNSRSNAQIVGRFFNIQGLLFWHQGEAESALESWQEAIEAYGQGDYPQGILGSQLNRARAFQALGFINRAQDNVEALHQTLMAQSDSAFKVLGLRNIGNVFWQMGEVTQALDILKQSLEVEGQSNRDRSQTMILLGNVERTAMEQAIAIRNKAEAQMHQTEALQWYQQAARMSRDRSFLQAKALVNELNFLVALTKWDLGNQGDQTQDDSGRWHQALEHAAAIEPTIDHLSSDPSTLSLQLNYAQSLSKIAMAFDFPASPLLSFPSLSQRFVAIIRQSDGMQDIYFESYAHGELGHLYEAKAQWASAQPLTEQALALANQIQSADIQYRWEWQMGRIFAAQMIEGRKGSGIERSGIERSGIERSGIERSGIEGNEVGSGGIAPVSMRHRAIASYRQAAQVLEEVRRDLLVIDTDIQFSFRDDVEPLYREYVDVLLRAPNPSSQTLSMATKLIDSLQLAELENSLRCDVNRFLQISQATVDGHTAVVYPMVLDDRLEVVLRMPHKKLQRHPVEVSREDVESLTSDLQTSLQRASQRNTSKELASKFYEWLIKPWEDDLQIDEAIESSTIDTLVFVLDGDLKSVPMNALWDKTRQRYLLERYAIAVAPSLQLVKPEPLERPIRVLAAGSTEGLNHPITGRTFTPLPNVDDEIAGISELMPTETLLNEDFTRSNLEEKLETESFDILHLATHGEFSADPNQTFILLDDTPLYAKELDKLLRLNNNIQAPIKMIVLSACQTAKGDRRATLGLAGLTLRAGAQSALATLWSVEDQSASILMQEFYRQLVDHPEISRAEALRRSQLALWQQGEAYNRDWEAPYFWSPYMLVGNWL